MRLSNQLHQNQIGDWADSTAEQFREFLATGITGVVIALLVIVGLVLAVVALWLSSRGKFMFLDNLVHGRSEVRRPWNEFKAEGDALFIWQVVFMLVVVAVMGIFFITGLMVFVPMGAIDGLQVLSVPAVILGGIILFVVSVTLGYISFFLNHFIVPIMYRERIGVNAAWSRFLVLMRAYPGSFVVYGLFYVLIMFVGQLAYVIAGALACCVGLLLLALPYIHTVLMLPLSTLGRFWDLEFLAQFGDDYRLLDELGGPATPPPPSPSVTALAMPAGEPTPDTDLGNAPAAGESEPEPTGTEEVETDEAEPAEPTEPDDAGGPDAPDESDTDEDKPTGA